MGGKVKTRRAAGDHKREITKPPAPVSEDQWRKRVAEALVFKLRKIPSNSDLDIAVNESLRIRTDFSRQLAQTKSGFRPSEKRKILTARITSLDRAAKTIREELLAPDFPPAIMPGDTRPRDQPDKLSIDARIAWDDRLHGQSGQLKNHMKALFQAFGEVPEYADMAVPIRQTLKIMDALKTRYDFICSAKNSDPIGVDFWMSSDQFKRIFVNDLMNVFCNLRGEQIDEVPIGNAKSTLDGDDGSPTNPNPLLNFMNLVVTPIKELNFPPAHWVRPGTLRGIAREIRRGNWWR